MVVGLSMQSIWNINNPPKFPKFNFKKCSKLIAKNIARTRISCILYERSKPLDYWDLSNIPLKNQTKSKFITVFYNTFTYNEQNKDESNHDYWLLGISYKERDLIIPFRS